MKCDYCNGEDHLVTACAQKKSERTFRSGAGCFFAVLLSPALILGAIMGALSSAFMAGFSYTSDFWKRIMESIRGRRDDEQAV